MMGSTRWWCVALVLGVLGAGCEVDYHPPGWAQSSAHGLATNEQTEDCRICHGSKLRGAIARDSCDGCHKPGWRSDCSYCHGNTLTGGAPPRDLDGQANPRLVRFRPHTVHVRSERHAEYSCDQCHANPADATSPGHIFDDSPGRAELVFSGGLSPDARYDGAGTCSEVYCHGDGNRTAGTVRDEGRALTCDGCHADDRGSLDDWATMSGEHSRHLVEGSACVECHGEVVNTDHQVAGADLHVDGAVSLGFTTSAVAWNEGSGRCSGTCHDHNHDGNLWGRRGGGPGGERYHPDSWAVDDTLHGPEAKLQRDDCRACHGADLRGGTSGVSCDSCHAEGWRTDCSFCHKPIAEAGLPSAFGDHSEHATRSANHVAFACEVCHVEPENVLDPGHMFDDSPALSETTFTGLAAGTTWDGEGRCASNTCHGNGRGANGVSQSGDSTSCGSCHADSTTRSRWSSMSGKHSKHLSEGLGCVDCHRSVVDATDAIIDRNLHVNGDADVLTVNEITRNGTSCTGRCHNESHNGERW